MSSMFRRNTTTTYLPKNGNAAHLRNIFTSHTRHIQQSDTAARDRVNVVSVHWISSAVGHSVALRWLLVNISLQHGGKVSDRASYCYTLRQGQV